MVLPVPRSKRRAVPMIMSLFTGMHPGLKDRRFNVETSDPKQTPRPQQSLKPYILHAPYRV